MRYLDCPTCGSIGQPTNTTHFKCDRGHVWQRSDWERERILAAERAAQEHEAVAWPPSPKTVERVRVG